MITRHDVLKQRAYEFALRIIKLFRGLPISDDARIIGKQLLRAGTSVAANYRAAGRARSHAEFVSKMGIVVEEADESRFWLDLLVDSGIVSREVLAGIDKEAEELLAIFAASYHTAKKRRP